MYGFEKFFYGCEKLSTASGRYGTEKFLMGGTFCDRDASEHT